MCEEHVQYIKKLETMLLRIPCDICYNAGVSEELYCPDGGILLICESCFKIKTT